MWQAIKDHWFVHWLRGCARLWRAHRRNLWALPPLVAAPSFSEWPPPGFPDSFGNATVAKARPAKQDQNLPKVIAKAIFGELDAKPTKWIKTLVTYEDGTEQVIYERYGRLKVFVDQNRTADGADEVVVYHRSLVEGEAV